MKPYSWLVPLSFSLLLAVQAAAQEVRRDVVPGREFCDTKVLTQGQTDLWAVVGLQDEVLKCHVSATDLDPVLELVDAAGNVLASNDGVGSESFVQYRLPKASKVQFRVNGFQGAGSGRYALTLERFVAVSLSLGGETQGRYPQQRWFHLRLQLEKNDCFVPVVFGGRLTAVIRFATNECLGENLGAYTVPEAGEYHLRLEGDERQEFTLRTLLPVYREAAAGALVSAVVPPFGLDIVHMKLPGGVAAMLDLGMPGVQLQQWHRLLGEDPKWRELGNAQKGGRSRRLFLPERELEVQLWLRNPEAAAAPYEFCCGVADLPLDAAGATPGVLPLGDLRCHVLQAAEGEVVTVRVAAEAFDPAMVVCAPNGEEMACIRDSGPLDRDASLTFCAPFRGTYRVIPYAECHTGSGAYRVEVTHDEVPRLGFGRSLELQVGSGRDAYAKLTLAAGQEVWLSVRSGDCDVALSIDADDGPRYATWEGGGVDGNVLAAFRAPKAGTFTLFVHSRRGAGKCQLAAHAVE